MLFFDKGLQKLEVISPRTGRVFIKGLTNIESVLQNRQRGVKLSDRCLNRLTRPVLGLLPIKYGKFGLLFGKLIKKKLTLQCHHTGRGIRRRLELLSGSPSANSDDSRAISSLAAMRIRLVVFRSGPIDGRVKLNQSLAGFDELPIAEIDGVHHAGLKRLNDLGAATRNVLALG